MGYATLAACLADLERHGQLVRIEHEVDPRLEAGAIQRRVQAAGGPALLFSRVKGTVFPLAANIFGTLDRTRFLFRHDLPVVRRLLQLRAEPVEFLKRPHLLPGLLRGLGHTLPKRVRRAPVLARETTLSQLPQLVSWPRDGGAYVTLPQVYTEQPSHPGFVHSNLGMYRVQLSGNDYAPDREAGLHYQIHRGIGPHHAEAMARGESLPVNVFVGGPPAMTLAAVMPLPEGMSELFFAGLLGGRRVGMACGPLGLPVLAEADFCICGRVEPHGLKPEGPFGDHLGYYSLVHDFPVLKVEKVYHRPDAVWPFTTVGRPPQEDTVFGAFIHELTEGLLEQVFCGIHEVHAVDAAGVHPLLLAVGSERYVPFAPDRIPQELLTGALSLLGSTQTSLSKYVLVTAREDAPQLSAHDVPEFFRHMLERTDFARDLHFITRTTMDTLDYSGISLNQGSKLVWVAAGEPRRRLANRLPGELRLPEGFGRPQVFASGMVLVSAPAHALGRDVQDPVMQGLAATLEAQNAAGELDGLPLFVAVDDALFAAANWSNFLWTAFTRSDPATDLYGAGAFIHCKHWGCRGPLVMDARLKTYHAPALEPDPEVERRVDELGAPGGPLHGII